MALRMRTHHRGGGRKGEHTGEAVRPCGPERLPAHSCRAKDEEDDTKKPREILITKLVHEVCAKPSGKTRTDSNHGDDAPIDETFFS